MKFVKHVKELLLHLLVILFNKLFCFLSKQFGFDQCKNCTCPRCTNGINDFVECSACDFVSDCKCAEVKIYE